MTTPYYQDNFVTLYHGDCLEILPALDLQAAALLTDPPYFKVKKDAWDNQWGGADQFLGWMGSWLDAAKPLLAANGSVWVFASPAMANSVERVVGERFRVLNSIRWAKPGGDNLRRVSLPAMRSFVSIWEGIIFAEQVDDVYGDADYSFRKDAYKSIGAYLRDCRVRAGLTQIQLGEALFSLGVFSSADSARANTSLNELGAQKVSASVYAAMSEHLDLKPFSEIAEEYKRAQEEHARLRRPFTITERRLSEDIWHFKSVPGRPGKHPCEKPAEMLRHMIEASTREGDLVLDPFAGSGSALETARNLGRRAVGVEKDERWCEHAASRLSVARIDRRDAA